MKPSGTRPGSGLPLRFSKEPLECPGLLGEGRLNLEAEVPKDPVGGGLRPDCHRTMADDGCKKVCASGV